MYVLRPQHNLNFLTIFHFSPIAFLAPPCYNGRASRENKRFAAKYGALAQLVARNVRIVEVRGSNPLGSTIKKSHHFRWDFLFFMYVFDIIIMSCP